MATVKEKPKSQKRKTERRQAATEKAILSRAAATKSPAPPNQKRVAPAADSQQIAGLRSEIERLTAENGKLQAEIKCLQGVVFSQNEGAAKLIEERNEIARKHQQTMDFLKAHANEWVFIQWED